ncbi:uncharacterized protein L201_002288 [Kwoniella dendrophila CBS 6074]|uniref:Uncharacterized protein n=1 Tax=Kwoniella dendrophila CBS 6074 TaxID=1295534 RepID=A0AAX4JRM7_9TREE
MNSSHTAQSNRLPTDKTIEHYMQFSRDSWDLSKGSISVITKRYHEVLRSPISTSVDGDDKYFTTRQKEQDETLKLMIDEVTELFNQSGYSRESNEINTLETNEELQQLDFKTQIGLFKAKLWNQHNEMKNKGQIQFDHYFIGGDHEVPSENLISSSVANASRIRSQTL